MTQKTTNQHCWMTHQTLKNLLYATLLILAACPLIASAQSAIHVHPNATMHVHGSGSVMSIWADIKNEGTLNSKQGTEIIFYGSIWENTALQR